MTPDTTPPKGGFIADLKFGETVTIFAALVKCDIKTTRSGGTMLSLRFQDRTGGIDGVMWAVPDEVASGSVKADIVVRVKALVSKYEDKPQLAVERIREAKTGEYRIEDMLPTTPKDIAELERRLFLYLFELENTELAHALQLMLGENCDAIRASPAGVRIHHPYVGGLLEHMVSMLGAAQALCAHYPRLNRDWMYAGCILHDIGKIVELSVGVQFDYSTPGRLVGHIGIGLLLLEKYGVSLSQQTKLVCQHLIASHHGEIEHGAMVLPQMPEAVALHYIDGLDARLEQAWRLTDAIPAGEQWTVWDFRQQRSFFKPVYEAAVAAPVPQRPLFKHAADCTCEFCRIKASVALPAAPVLVGPNAATISDPLFVPSDALVMFGKEPDTVTTVEPAPVIVPPPDDSLVHPADCYCILCDVPF